MAPAPRTVQPLRATWRALVAGALGLTAGAFAPRGAPAQVLTAQMNAARTGADTTERLLTPRNVNVRTFGHRFRIPADGDVYAQPLILPRVRLADGRTLDLVFIATEHGSVAAWDADRASAAPVWRASFVRPAAGVTAVPSRDVRCPLIQPEVGITCTPVIDPVSGTLYVLARTRERRQGRAPRYVQRLHALDVRSGAERAGSPVVIRAAVRGTGDGARDGIVAFDPLRENPRAPLLLARGRVVACWASSCDVEPYHGWVMAFDARTLAPRGVVCTSPGAGLGGIWQSDTGPAADAAGRVYAITGNGGFDAQKGGADFGNSVIALEPEGDELRLVDSFTPFDQARLDAEDGDLGSGGPVLAGGDASGPARIVFAGKNGRVYVLDPRRLGGYHENSDAGAVQTFDSSQGEYGAPAYWNGHLYLQGTGVPLRDHALRDGRLSREPLAQSRETMENPGATPLVSANGARDGIVWTIQSRPFAAEDRPAVLRAHDAANVATLLWSSEQDAARDRAGNALRFTIPSVWSGRVYVPTRGGVDVYGLLADGR